MEIVQDCGDWLAEYHALRESAGILDFSFRSRICLVGNDRVRFLHGQVTNDIKKLRVGEGCYAAITTAKGKMESDLNIFNLPDELLLDFEPGLTEKISARLEKFIVADDVQIVDVAPHYGLLSVQGPKAEQIIRALNLFLEIPAKPFDSLKISEPALGEIYLANHPQLTNWWGERPREPLAPTTDGSSAASPHQNGFDLFVPNHSLGALVDKLIAAAKNVGGKKCGWTAFETVRIENGIPRFGADMDETNLPLEGGVENRALNYRKGCYIGQEVLNRIHSFGHVTKELRGLRLADDLKTLPQKNAKLFFNGKEVGYVTSAVKSPALKNLALGYVRREANQIGNELTLQTAGGSLAKIVELPFVKNPAR
jgi:folate-binding protein YgfZ